MCQSLFGMGVGARKVSFAEVEPRREAYRREANCQIVHDSILPRGLADAYLLVEGERSSGYGGVWNSFDPGRIMEFYVDEEDRASSAEAFEALVLASASKEIEAQTNMPTMLGLLEEFGTEARAECLLFSEGSRTDLPNPGALFRRATDEDDDSAFGARTEPRGEWVLELGGKVVANGGILTHYNPPHADLFMEVAEPYRRRGFGSYLVQEMMRVCTGRGLVPCARCNPDNLASRRTLKRAGLVECGTLLVATLKPKRT